MLQTHHYQREDLNFGEETIRNKHILIVGISCQIQERDIKPQLNNHQPAYNNTQMFCPKKPTPLGHFKERKNQQEMATVHQRKSIFTTEQEGQE